MLKFVKNHMESIAGIEIYPIISLLIFFIFFVVLFWWVFTAKKEYINKVSNIPLDNQNQSNYEKYNTILVKSTSCIFYHFRLVEYFVILETTSIYRATHNMLFLVLVLLILIAIEAIVGSLEIFFIKV